MRGTTPNLLTISLALMVSPSLRAGEVALVFTNPVITSLPEPFFPTMFKARDLDGDNIVDLVVAGRDPDDRLLTLKGVGNGAYVPLQTLVAQGFTDWVELADIDGDGRDDVITAWRGALPRVVAYRGLPGGQFEEAAVLAGIELGTGRDPQGLAVADFDMDGDNDIAVSSYIGQSIEIFSNTGGMTFERVTRVRLASFLGGYGYPRLLHAGDLDGDGDLDLVANEIGGSRIATIRNEGGSFARAVEYRAPLIGDERPGISAVTLADIDGDGDLDAYSPALLLYSTQKIVYFRNDGTGRFTERLVGEGSPSGYAFSVELADLDADGDLDAITGAALPGTLTVGRRTSAGDFVFEEDGFYMFGQLIRHIDAIDYDGDCDLDILSIDGPSRAIYTRRNMTPQAGCGGGGVAEIVAKSIAITPEPTGALKNVVQPELPTHDRNGDGAVDASDVAVWLSEMSMPISLMRTEKSPNPVVSPTQSTAIVPTTTVPKIGHSESVKGGKR